jgi:hypothetical protein
MPNNEKTESLAKRVEQLTAELERTSKQLDQAVTEKTELTRRYNELYRLHYTNPVKC